jgi:hypothetical protein
LCFTLLLLKEKEMEDEVILKEDEVEIKEKKLRG